MIKFQIIGRVGKDPETREIGDSKVTKFPVAHSEKYKKNGEIVEQTTWVTVEAWDKTGDILAKYVQKGDQIFIEGTPKAEAWSDKEGNAKSNLVVRVRDFAFLGSNKKNSNTEQPKDANQPSVNTSEDDNLPF